MECDVVRELRVASECAGGLGTLHSEGRQRRQFGAGSEFDPTVPIMLDRQRSAFYDTALHLMAVDRRLGHPSGFGRFGTTDMGG
jgi:hypothetical protein